MDGFHCERRRIMGVLADYTVAEQQGFVTVTTGKHEVLIDVVEDYGEANPRTFKAALKEAERRIREAIQLERDARAARYR